MEDVKLGRQTQTLEMSKTVTTSSQLLIDADPNRTLLMLLPTTSGTVTISTINPVVAGTGIIIPAASPPVILDIKTHGLLVTKAFHVIHSAGGVKFNWIQGHLDKK